MKTTLKTARKIVIAEFEAEIKKIDFIPVHVKNELINLFSCYTPFKERAYFFKSILSSVNFDNNLSKLFYLGIESAFISYYCKDDIIDNTTGRALNINEGLSKYSISLLQSDLMLELAYFWLNVFNEKTENIASLKNTHSSFLQLSLGQLLSLNMTIENYPDPNFVEKLCYYKSGSLYENGLSALSKLINNKQDFLILKKAGRLIGTGSQIRNDIEDIIVNSKNTENDFMEDLRNAQANYVLAHFFNSELSESEFQTITKYFNKDISRPVNQDIVFELLESKNAISKSIIKLDNIKNEILLELSSLSNTNLSNDISNYAEYLLSIHPKL